MSANTALKGHVRRLRPTRAVASALRGLPRLWAGGWAGLLLLALMIPLGGWTTGSDAAQHLFTGMAVVLTLAVWTGLTAVALDRDPPPGGVATGPVLLRVVLAAGLNLIFLAMIAVVLALVSLAIAGMSGLDLEAIQARDWANVGPVWQLAVLGLVGLIVLIVPLLLIVRLSLFVQATVGRGHAVSLNTMGIAQGSFWALMLLFLGLAVPPLALLGWAASHGLIELAMVALIGLWMPLSAGALAAAYGQLEYWSPDSPGHLGEGEMKTFDIMEALAEPFRQAGRRPLATIVWGLVGLLPSAGGVALLFHLFGSDMFIEDPDFESGADMAAFFQFQSWSMLVNLLEWLVSIVVIVAVTRATFAGRRKDGAFFMRVGADEFRVLVASLVIMVAAILALFVLALICVGIGALIWQLPELPRALGFVVLGIAAFLLILLASGRAYLILPACVWHHSLAFEQGWKLGRGQSWRLVGLLIMLVIVTLVMSLVIIVVGLILLFVIGAILGGWDMPAMDDPEGWMMNMFEQPLVWGVTAAVLLVPLAWVQGFFQLLGNAPFAHVVRELSAEADSARETPADNPDESV